MNNTQNLVATLSGGGVKEANNVSLLASNPENVSTPYEYVVTANSKFEAAFEPKYTEKSWTTPGTYNWTVPEYVYMVNVAVCGGGSGGNTTDDSYGARVTNSGPGGDSSFGDLITAEGAGAVWASINNPIDGYQWNGRTYSGRSWVRWDSPYTSRGTAICGDHVTAQRGAQGWALGFNSVRGSYGSGGLAYTGNPDDNCVAASGSSGVYRTGSFPVTPGQVIPIAVGAGGARLAYVPDTGTNTAAGTSGFVLISYGSD